MEKKIRDSPEDKRILEKDRIKKQNAIGNSNLNTRGNKDEETIEKKDTQINNLLKLMN